MDMNISLLLEEKLLRCRSALCSFLSFFVSQFYVCDTVFGLIILILFIYLFIYYLINCLECFLEVGEYK
jgi:hypothetical protein